MCGSRAVPMGDQRSTDLLVLKWWSKTTNKTTNKTNKKQNKNVPLQVLTPPSFEHMLRGLPLVPQLLSEQALS